MSSSREITSLIDLHRFPTGRRLFALRRVLERVSKRDGDPALRARIAAAIAEDERTRALEIAWSGREENAQHGAGAKALDAELDRSLAALDQFLAAQVKVLGPEHESHQAAVLLRKAAFPNGLTAVTSLPYVLEQEEVRRILTELRAPGRAEAAEMLGLTPHVEVIAALNERYRELLNVDRDDLSWQQVLEARAEGQARLAWIVVLLLAAFVDQPEARAEVLAPVFDQDRAIVRHRKGRTSSPDVDPETGVEISDEPGEEDRPTDAESAPAVAHPTSGDAARTDAA
jgi:hypothetical protein